MRPHRSRIANYGCGVAMTTDVPAMIKIKPARRFLRFDRLFNDAVRSKRRSAIVEVLLRVQLSADNAPDGREGFSRTARFNVSRLKSELPTGRVPVAAATGPAVGPVEAGPEI